eukprot:TRINITY_DN2657_c0_g1_i1.p1 TRINITY_DN2657_c0_g1~~TRINITY_DN2657_c0_g1_i1.p1  ORF type:complete len:652 (-),score=86.56 TRINITY_DN2657_c0_g1_i1:126-2081(-)
MKLLAIFNLFIFLLFVSKSISLSVINGTGSTLAQPVYNNYIFAYTLIKPSISITYTGSGSGIGRTSVVNNSALWGGTDVGLTAIDRAQAPNVQAYPMIAGGIVPAYFLPSVTKQLFLGRDELGLIFAGNITMWNDVRLQSINPNITLPNQPINVVVRSDSSGTTQIFTQTLSMMSPTFAAQVGTVTTFPSRFTNYSRQNGNEGVRAYIQVIPYSLGYIAYSAVSQVPVSWATVRNRDGNIATDPINGIFNNIARANFSSDFTSSIADLPGNDSWPIAGFTYIVMQTRANDRCEERREFMKFILFNLQDPNVRSSNIQGFYVNLPFTIVEQVKTKLLNNTCNGLVSARYILIPQHTSGVFPAIYALAGIGLFIVLAMAIVFLISPGEKLSFSEIVYIIVFTFGCVVGIISVFFWADHPRNNSVCLARQWLTPLGLAIVLSALSSRLFQIAMIFQHYIQAKRVTRAKLNLWLFASMIASIVAIVIILILWSAIDQYRKVEFVLNQNELSTDLKCDSNNLDVFLSLIAAVIGVLLVWCMVVIYMTWSINNQVGSSRWLVMSVYNILLSLLVLIPLVFRGTTNDNDLCIIISIGALFIMVSTACSIFIPKLIRAYRKKTRKDNSSSPTRKSEAGANEDEFNEIVRVAKRIDKDKN